MLLLVGCGGAATSNKAEEAQPTNYGPVACVTNLDAGMPCDPCPGAASLRQTVTPTWTSTSCDRPLPDGGSCGMVWVGCGEPTLVACEAMLKEWNAECEP